MGKFKKNDGFGTERRFEGGRDFRRNDRSERPQMFRAVCSDCGRSCEVPFKPTGERAVFCSDCFGKKDGGNNNRFEKKSFERKSFGDKPMFRATCGKCGKSCEVPFKPTGDKPVFCSDCFGKTERGGAISAGNAPSDQYRKQFEMLNGKLDSILKLLAPKAAISKSEKLEQPELVIAAKTNAKISPKTPAVVAKTVKVGTKAVKAEVKPVKSVKAKVKKEKAEKAAPAKKAVKKKRA